MAFNRTERISEEIKRELSSIIRTVKDPRMSSMTSIVSASVTKDLKYVKVYVSVLGTEEEKNGTMEALKSATGYIKKEIGARGLRSIIEKAMQKVMYSIPDMTDAKKVVVTSGVIDGTEDALVYGARNKKIA